MTNKPRHQEARVHEAAKLARCAMKLQRAPLAQIDGLLYEANRCLQRYKVALLASVEKASGTIEDTVAQDLEAPMQALDEVIRETIEPHGFCLLVFNIEDIGGRINYVSNAVRDDICVAMREFIAAHEERLLPAPKGKH
jgi:hypothetical protein